MCDRRYGPVCDPDVLDLRFLTAIVFRRQLATGQVAIPHLQCTPVAFQIKNNIQKLKMVMPDLHPHHEDHPQMISRAARRGLALFLIYFVLYAGFLLLNVFAPEAMARTVIALQPIPQGRNETEVLHYDLHGLNLALVYGLALIVAAILLAFFYMRLTKRPRP
jgi:uncharacterized membrane protein (DUF485 family)